MNKAELIDELTRKLGSDRRHATDAVEHVVDSIVRAVQKGESVTITGFGVFEQRRRAARVARNPRTGETVKVRPTSVPAFRPGAQFKKIVSGAQRLPSEGPAVKRGSGSTGGRKAAAKKASKRTAAKKTTAKKAAKKAPAKKAATKRTATKSAAKKTTAKKAPAKKAATKSTARKTTAKKAAKKTTARKATTKRAASKAPAKKTAAKKAPAKRGRR
ncbi:MAG: HU family DNA-binding protein [Mycobacterium sp.]